MIAKNVCNWKERQILPKQQGIQPYSLKIMWFKTHPLKQSLVPRYESSLQILGSQWQGWRNLKFLIFPNKRWHLGPFSKMHHDGGIWGIENYNHKLLFLSHGKSLDSGSRSYQLPEILGVNRVNLRKAFWGHEGIPETARASVARLIGALPDLRAGMNSFEVLGVGMGDIGWHGKTSHISMYQPWNPYHTLPRFGIARKT